MVGLFVTGWGYQKVRFTRASAKHNQKIFRPDFQEYRPSCNTASMLQCLPAYPLPLLADTGVLFFLTLRRGYYRQKFLCQNFLLTLNRPLAQQLYSLILDRQANKLFISVTLISEAYKK